MKKAHVFLVFAILSICILSYSDENADIKKTDIAYWICGGIGMAAANLQYPITLGSTVGLNLQIGKHIFYSRHILGGVLPTINVGTTINELGFLSGRIARMKHLLMSFAIGLSYNVVFEINEPALLPVTIFSWSISSITRTKDGNGYHYITLGIPIDLRIIYTPLRFLGVGVTVSLNLNTYRLYAAVYPSVHVGRIKVK